MPLRRCRGRLRLFGRRWRRSARERRRLRRRRLNACRGASGREDRAKRNRENQGAGYEALELVRFALSFGLEGTLLLRNRLERGRINGEVFERHLSDAGSDYAGRRSRILRLVLAVKLLKTPQKSRLDFSSVFFRGVARFLRSSACVITT